MAETVQFPKSWDILPRNRYYYLFSKVPFTKEAMALADKNITLITADMLFS